jgi:sterol desaturase/sphingolipid hydroxylase (fatty acid hydroxylase superfamily)
MNLPDPPLALLIIPAAFALLATLEWLAPALPAKRGRWPLNLGLGLANAVLGRLLAALGPVAAASWAATHDTGLLRLFELPPAALLILSIMLLDGAIYWQHRAMHHWHWAWWLHRLHHADPAIDVSTGIRFHPGEILVSLAYKSAVVVALGAPVSAVIAFELYLALFSMAEHSNIRLPARWEGPLRRLWVTPAMHRIHHSAHGDDHNHNYGFALALWDYLFGSYQPAARSASVTGEASALASWSKAERNKGRIAAPAASARRMARAMSLARVITSSLALFVIPAKAGNEMIADQSNSCWFVLRHREMDPRLRGDDG